jgi:hypothetical protein
VGSKKDDCRARIAQIIKRAVELDGIDPEHLPDEGFRLSRKSWLFTVREMEALARVFPQYIERTPNGYWMLCPACGEHSFEMSLADSETPRLLH